ncbi:hypothetical protein [Microcoleus sp. BROC3]
MRSFDQNQLAIAPATQGLGFSPGILGSKKVFWSIELVLFSTANQTI